jgi:uncharacterized protein YegL
MKTKPITTSLVAFLVALVASLTFVPRIGAQPASGASGGNVEVYLTVKPPNPNDPKSKDEAPGIEATIINGPNTTLDKFLITEPTAKKPYQLKAATKREFTQGTETLALALVINGQEIWIGNDDVEPEIDPLDPQQLRPNPARVPGILKPLKTALQAVPFATAGPAGSKGILITYADKAEIRQPMGDLKTLNAEALGSQKDYHKKLGTAMVRGVELALTQLNGVAVTRKVLILVCDGTDTDNDAAKAQLTNLKRQAQADQVQVFAIIYKGPMSDPINVVTQLTSNVYSLQNADGIGSTIANILKQMGNRFYLTFPGYDKVLKTGPRWDGKPHELQLKINNEDAGDPVNLTLSPTWRISSEGGFPWLILIIILVVVLLFIIIGVKVFGGKKEPVPVPAPVAMMAAPMPEAPKPAGPMKTVMMSAGGDLDGFPIVGWLVPLNGQNAYQTMRLRSGGTKIGTAPPCDLIINDGFMSTDHCMIQCSPQGFTLIDGGSTNGCYVNDKKIQKHDLVDNDMITLGKTNLKFKSIS